MTKKWEVKVMREDLDDLVMWGEFEDDEFRPIFYLQRGDCAMHSWNKLVKEIERLLNDNAVTEKILPRWCEWKQQKQSVTN